LTECRVFRNIFLEQANLRQDCQRKDRLEETEGRYLVDAVFNPTACAYRCSACLTSAVKSEAGCDMHISGCVPVLG
jgi:hypothetical protein